MMYASFSSYDKWLGGMYIDVATPEEAGAVFKTLKLHFEFTKSTEIDVQVTEPLIPEVGAIMKELNIPTNTLFDMSEIFKHDILVTHELFRRGIIDADAHQRALDRIDQTLAEQSTIH